VKQPPVLVQKRYLKAGRHVRLLDLRVRIVAQLLDSGRALGPHTFASFSKAEQAIGVIFAIVSPVTLCHLNRGVRTQKSTLVPLMEAPSEQGSSPRW